MLCVMMVLHFMPVALLSADDLHVVYSMTEDNEIQGKEISSTFEGTIWLERCGSPTLTIIDNGGYKAISVTDRTEDWHCIDLKNLISLSDGFEYTIMVTGISAVGAKMKLSQPESPYATHTFQNVGDDGTFSLEKKFTYAELQTEKKVRIQSEGTTGDFTIYNIVITAAADDGNHEHDGIAIDDVDITFDLADLDEWGENFCATNADNVEIQWVSDFGKADNFSLKGTHLPTSSDYTGALNAIRLTFDEPLAKNAIYTVSYSVYVPYEGNVGKETLTGPGIVLNNDYAGSTGVSKFPADFGTIDIGTWKDVIVITPATGLNDTLKSIDFRFVVNEAQNHPDVWYIDNISISQQIIDADNNKPDFKDYQALKDVYKDYFLIGTTSGNHRMSGDKLDIIKYHFNAFTPENEMKPSSVQKDKGTFTFNDLDEQFAKVSGLQLIGHTLAWHSQSPSWMWGTPTPLSSEEAKANMGAHIESVMNKYGADLYSIDVVNEAMADGRNNDDWRLNLRDSEGWYLALGWEWVEYAFLKTSEIVDANGWDCKLYYNDYNLDQTYKARAVYNMVKDINERYEGVRPNGKPLIEGIGMQGHYNQSTNPASVEKSIDLFSTLPGVAISITELDITYSNTGGLTDQQLKSQALKYAQLFDIFMRNAAGPANSGDGRIERITFWGTNDGDSWRGNGYPLLFDRNLRAKEAFLALLDPVDYLSNADPPQEIPKAKSVFGTAELGVNDSIWQKANVIHVDKKPTNQAEAAGATAIVKTLWDTNYFYVRAEVNDASLHAISVNPWEQDSVEIFFSETGHREVEYKDGDGQYRVSYEGNESFRSAEMGEGFSSHAEVTDTGYIVEMKIPLRVIKPNHGDAVTFDVQINDVSGGADTRRLTVWSDLEATGYNTTERWGDLYLTRNIDGIQVYDTGKGDEWSGANIILGNDAGKWPWSTSGADGKVAFTAEKEATYRITVNYTALGTNAIRLRWIKDATNGGYTVQDSNAVGDSPSLDPSQVATSIPVYFNKGMSANNTYTLITEIKLDGSQPAEGLIGNIAIRGGAGGNDFTINRIQVEKIGEDGTPDTLLVNWPDEIKEPITYTATANGAARTATSSSIALIFDKPVPGLTAEDIIITAATANVEKGDLSKAALDDDTQYNLTIRRVTREGTINLRVIKDGVDDTVKTITVHKKSASDSSNNQVKPTSKPTATPTPLVLESHVPTGADPPANISNMPVEGVIVETPKEALDYAEKAFAKNASVVKVSQPITVATPPKENVGLTPVSIALPADIEFTAIVSPNADGSFTSVPVYTDKNGMVYVLIDETKTLIPVTISGVFSDVSEDQWFAGFVRAAAEAGIIFGYGDHTFVPNDTTTNQQTVTMLMRSVGFGIEYSNALQTAAEKGIAFASELVNDGITSRTDTAVLIKDILMLAGVDVSCAESEIDELLASFNDISSLSEEERLSFAVAVKYGILKGTYVGEDYSKMSPDILLTRAQIATISVRLVEFLTSN